MDEPQKPRDRALDEAVSRALRDNLPSLQRTAEELQEAFADFVSACSSARAANALPAMLRARTAAGALSARLDILSAFITTSLQPRERSLDETILLPQIPALEQPAETPLPHRIAVPMSESAEIQVEPVPADAAPALERVPEPPTVTWPVPAEEVVAEPLPRAEIVLQPAAVDEPAIFDIAALPFEERELHRRANRLAKVAMQDIQMLRPEDVRLGREHKDLCARLRGDLDKARKEYDRRFTAIQDHPVDYFHYWLVEVLAAGNSEALGEYPYPSPVLRH